MRFTSWKKVFYWAAIYATLVPAPALTKDLIVTWEPPTLFEDLNPIGEGVLGGYELFYRNVNGGASTYLEITDSTITSIPVTGISNGTYEFRITSFTINNIYGEYSDPTFVIVDEPPLNLELPENGYLRIHLDKKQVNEMSFAGYQTLGATRLSTNRGIFYRIRANSTGDIIKAFARMDSNGVAVNALAAIYASTEQDLTGVPTGSPLSIATSVAINIASGSPEVVEFDFPSPAGIDDLEYFHLFVATDNTGTWGIWYDDNNADDNSVESTNTNNAAVPDPVDISGPNTDWDPTMYVEIQASGVTGTGAGTLSQINGSGSGQLNYTAAGAGDLSPITGNSTGALLYDGQGVGELSPVTGQSQGQLSYTGTSTGVLSSITGEAIGSLAGGGIGIGTLQSITGESQGQLFYTSQASGDLQAILGESAGQMFYTGTGVGSLQPIAGQAAGTTIGENIGEGTLQAVNGDASGNLIYLGTGIGALSAVLGEASGIQVITSTAIGILAAITGSGTQLFTNGSIVGSSNISALIGTDTVETQTLIGSWQNG